MNQPSVYFISSSLSSEDIDKVRAALQLTPLAAVIICNPRDTDFARQITDHVSYLKQPIAIVADFAVPLTAVDEDGRLCPLLLPSNPSST